MTVRYWGRPPHDVFTYAPEGPHKRPLRHVVKHSPTGFSWGYAGSGPAELARCILLDHLGDEAVCDECVDFHGCDGGFLLSPSCYQAFKDEVIARLPQTRPWALDGSDISEWLETWRNEGHDALMPHVQVDQ